MTCGIYCITNLINGKQYVGQSVDIEKRMNDHIHSNNNSKIHQAIVKYGVNNFKFEPLIRCSPEELDEQEVKFIRLLNSYEKGYNQTRGGQHHVFNIEYNYENYSELKRKVQEKNDIISNLKQKNNELISQISELKCSNGNGMGEILRYKRELKTLQTEQESLINEKEVLQSENMHLRKTVYSYEHGALGNKAKALSKENKSLKKEIREFKQNIRTLNIMIEEKENIIAKRNREVQILHERLGWQPKNNIFDEWRL